VSAIIPLARFRRFDFGRLRRGREEVARDPDNESRRTRSG